MTLQRFVMFAFGIFLLLVVVFDFRSSYQKQESLKIELPQPQKIIKQSEPNVNLALECIFKLATINDKEVLMFLTTDNCVWCDKMKENVAKIDELNYLYLETKSKEIMQKYKPTGFPTIIIFDKTGKELKRKTGYMDADDFKNWLEERK